MPKRWCVSEQQSDTLLFILPAVADYRCKAPVMLLTKKFSAQILLAATLALGSERVLCAVFIYRAYVYGRHIGHVVVEELEEGRKRYTFNPADDVSGTVPSRNYLNNAIAVSGSYVLGVNFRNPVADASGRIIRLPSVPPPPGIGLNEL